MRTRDFYDQIDESSKRYEKRAAERGKRAGDAEWTAIDSVDRYSYRLESKGMAREARRLREWGAKKKKKKDDVLDFDPRERILGDNELTTATTLYQGAAQTHSTGRIIIRNSRGRRLGFGTGFLVSPSLLMTNNHVLEDAEEAASSEVQFFFWEDVQGRTGTPVTFRFEPDRFFVTNQKLDFTLVAVDEVSEGQRLKDLGWSPLIATSGKTTMHEPVNIIQHPRGGDQKVVLRQNKIIDVVDEFLHYEADTEPGSSGSPVFNVDWELAALHHAGVPKRDSQGRVLLKDDTVWDGSDSTRHLIGWVANEGTRISQIVKYLNARKSRWSASEQALYAECFEPAPAFDAVLPGIGAKRTTTQGNGPTTAEPVDRDGLLSAILRLFGREDLEAGFDDEVGLEMDRNYENREGYQSGFLGSGRYRVHLPQVRADLDEDTGVVLPYHTFSVCMHPTRRLARYTASNVHGRQMYRIARSDGRTSWVQDRRLSRNQQFGNSLYVNSPIDKGHLVRRLDAAWGDDRNAALAGNDDTFHYTNSIPQHEHLNEDDETWAGLEDHYLDHADARNRKITVFTGPVYRDDDREFRGARLPRQLWKIILYRRSNRIAADAYLLSQEELIRGDLGPEVFREVDAEFEEAFGGDAFSTFQVPVSMIDDLTGLDLDDLTAGDTYGESFDPGESESDTPPVRIRRVASLDDIRPS